MIPDPEDITTGRIGNMLTLSLPITPTWTKTFTDDPETLVHKWINNVVACNGFAAKVAYKAAITGIANKLRRDLRVVPEIWEFERKTRYVSVIEAYYAEEY